MARFRGTLCCVPLTVAMRPYRYDVSWSGGTKIGELLLRITRIAGGLNIFSIVLRSKQNKD